MKKKKRIAQIERNTKETSIKCLVNLDGTGKRSIKTNEPFLNHMLDQLSKHSSIDLDLSGKGDVEIDSHHLSEDCGIVIGQAIVKALGDKKGIKRFGSAGVLDEALVRVVLDFSGRTYCDVNLKLNTKKVGTFDTELVEEFLNGLARGAVMTLHVDQLKGKNTHHVIEAVFKGLALALKDAVRVVGKELPSTKGKL
jgi:imidazoleglycerol-phosphate dehydratase